MAALHIDPGALRTELVLQTAQDVPDGAGGFVAGWLDTGTVFALIEPATPTSRFGAGRPIEDQTHRITLRHRAGVEPGMRMRRLDRAFLILTVHDPDESGRYLTCRVREETA